MPSSRKSKSKNSTISTISNISNISRIDKLPYDIKCKIYNYNYSEIFPLFYQHLQAELYIPRVDYKYIDYDYCKIIKKLKIKNSVIKNLNNIKDKRNFKDFNKKIDKFINTYVTPTVIEYGSIMDIIEPLSVNNDRHHDFEYYLNNINIVESKLRTHINRFNKLLYMLRSKFNTNFNLNELIFINQAIYHINKVTKKPLPKVITEETINKYIHSLSYSKNSNSVTKQSNSITRKIRSI